MSYISVEEIHSHWEWSAFDICAVVAVIVAAALKLKDCRARRTWLD